MPWLLLAATLVVAAGPWLVGLARRDGAGGAGPVASATAILAVSIYGGYVYGGLGILRLAVFGLIGFRNLHGMNGLKNILSAVLSLVSAVTYASAGLIAWEVAGVLALATAVGGLAGARLARRIERTGILRAGITVTGAAMTVAFFVL